VRSLLHGNVQLSATWWAFGWAMWVGKWSAMVSLSENRNTKLLQKTATLLHTANLPENDINKFLDFLHISQWSVLNVESWKHSKSANCPYCWRALDWSITLMKCGQTAEWSASTWRRCSLGSKSRCTSWESGPQNWGFCVCFSILREQIWNYTEYIWPLLISGCRARRDSSCIEIWELLRP